MTGVPRAVCAVAGAFHNLVLTEDGDVFAWGNGGYGQLGQGDTHNRSTPSVVQGLKGLQICQLAAGGWHSAALTEDGQVGNLHYVGSLLRLYLFLMGER